MDRFSIAITSKSRKLSTMSIIDAVLVGGPLDGFPMKGSSDVSEMAIPFNDEMLELISGLDTPEKIQRWRSFQWPDREHANGVAIYVRDSEIEQSFNPETGGSIGLQQVRFRYLRTEVPNP